VSLLLDRLIDADADYLQVHPSTLRGMLGRSREIGRRPRRLREVRTFGEVVEDDLRAFCRDHWGVPLTDNYSAEELGIVALQCPEHEHYHVQAESVLVEVLDAEGEPCAPGQVGRVVCTALHNVVTPLIRYELGDVAEVGGPCPCGRGLPVLKRILGRVRNLVTLPTGEQLHPVFREARLLAAAPLRQYQLTQTSMDLIEVALVTPRPPTGPKEDALGDCFSESFRHRFDYRFTYHEDLPAGPGGKCEVFRSAITDAR
jgi:phenylacetate-CoA ligase